jgi:hypothetical protein
MARRSQAKSPRDYRYRQGIHCDNTERDKKIVALREQGMTLEAIGLQCEPTLCGERVAQIVRRAERRKRPPSEDVKRLRDAFLRGGITGRG